MYFKYEFVLGLISVGDFPSISLRYNSQISKRDINCIFFIFFEIKSCYKIKQIMLFKVMKTMSILSSSKWNSYITIMNGFQFQNMIMIFTHLVFFYVIN